MKRMILFAAGLLVVAACNNAVTTPDRSLPGPNFAKWTTELPAGCWDATPGVKFQVQGTSLKITGTSGDDRVYCDNSLYDITFSGGDGSDIFYGGAGNDQIAGGNGNDYLNGGGGTNHINGGTGWDECVSGQVVTGCEDVK